MPAPIRNPAVLFCPGDAGYLAYDPASDQVHRLSAELSLVIELCDGVRTIEDIQSIAEPVFPAGSDGLAARCVEAGLAADLLCEEQSGVAAPDPESLVKELRDDGKIEAAFICQYNAAERTPEDAAQWSTLGELAHILGWREAARMAYERYLELQPDDAEVRHMLVALRGEAPPPRAANEVIEQLYERFSGFYEANVVDELDYQAPKRIAALVAEELGDRAGLAALDLGCGSGLAGVELRGRCRRLVGVDLSAPMIEIARERDLYDRLDVAEITDWLGSCQEQLDLIVACDTLIYFGDLVQVLAPAASLLKANGLFVLSVERGEQAPFTLSDNGRYTHHASHIREAARDAGLEVVRVEEGYLRMEYGEEVTGLFAVLRKSG